MDLNTLIAQRQALDAQITAAQNESRKINIGRVQALMAETGVTLQDLGASAPAARVQKTKGTKIPAKYRNAAGKTWSGRGFQPVWLRDALKAGHALESFLIAN